MTRILGLLLLVLGLAAPDAMAIEPQIPANQRPDVVMQPYFITLPPGINPSGPLYRVITQDDYSPPPPASSFITLGDDPVNTNLAPESTDLTRAIRIK